MSMIHCFKCNENIDSDFKEIEELDGEIVCIDCYLEEMEKTDLGDGKNA